jgi:hypothetical protein
MAGDELVEHLRLDPRVPAEANKSAGERVVGNESLDGTEADAKASSNIPRLEQGIHLA